MSAVDAVDTPRVEGSSGTSITFSQTLGTALGGSMADDAGGGGCLGGAIRRSARRWPSSPRSSSDSRISRVALSLGHVVADPAARRDGRRGPRQAVDHGGLELSRPFASLVIAAFIVVCLLVLPQRAGATSRRGQSGHAGR